LAKTKANLYEKEKIPNGRNSNKVKKEFDFKYFQINIFLDKTYFNDFCVKSNLHLASIK
jgi:hypothetical protein